MSTVAIPHSLTGLLDKPVAVLGAGVSGRAVEALLACCGCGSVLYDEGGKGNHLEFGETDARAHRLAVFSPGFAPDHPWLKAAQVAGCRVMGELEFASRFWKGKLLAITGTNGKTTLTEFLTEALNIHGRQAIAAGNVGLPLSTVAAADHDAETIAVCEISSFQAESLENFRADGVIWISFSETHMDRHGDMRNYFGAKWKLVERLRAPKLFVSTQVAVAAAQFDNQLPEWTVVSPKPPLVDMPETSAFWPKRQWQNLVLALAWWRSEGLPEEAALEVAARFPGRKHRMERLEEIDRVTFWDDSKATNFEACAGALENFSEPVIWIGGGRDRGGDVSQLAEVLAGRARQVFTIGETGREIIEETARRSIAGRHCASLEEAVQAAHAVALPGEQVLFSPGFSSHDMFRDYNQRGDVYKRAVLDLKARICRI